MVNRFLGWKLPKDFQPDGGISFKPTYNEDSPFGVSTNEPVGTNLFSATQAEAMVRYMLEGTDVLQPETFEHMMTVFDSMCRDADAADDDEQRQQAFDYANDWLREHDAAKVPTT